ncbi:MAG: hypothetical protein EHM35_08655 [Planctomycetaceae bacterium]|nr:MAG: hypothetical protein EHM35_08655 [Planctomycetaceae bacterium]
MITGMQGHIEAWVDPEELQHVYDKGVRLLRIAAMDCPVETMLSNIRDAKAIGFTIVVTLADAERIRLVAPLLTEGDLVECLNEADYDWPFGRRGIGDMPPSEYRAILDEFCRIGLEVGVPIGGPTCSNTNAKCVRWARAVKGTGWPAGLRYITWHSYDPHENTLFYEVEELADGLPIIFTEFGYPSHQPITWDEQAAKARALWPIYAKYHGACWFQMFDGIDQTIPDNCFGVRSVYPERVWKPVLDTFPQPNSAPKTEDDDMRCISKAESFESATEPGKFAMWYPRGQRQTILSVQPDGSWGFRNLVAIGGSPTAWEKWEPNAEGDRAIFYETVDVQGFPLVK